MCVWEGEKRSEKTFLVTITLGSVVKQTHGKNLAGRKELHIWDEIHHKIAEFFFVMMHYIVFLTTV